VRTDTWTPPEAGSTAGAQVQVSAHAQTVLRIRNTVRTNVQAMSGEAEVKMHRQTAEILETVKHRPLPGIDVWFAVKHRVTDYGEGRG